MTQTESFDVVILGRGQGSKRIAWHLGRSGKKAAVVQRQWVGSPCPAIACLPSKKELLTGSDPGASITIEGARTCR